MELIIVLIVFVSTTLFNICFSSAQYPYRRVFGGSKVSRADYDFIVRLEEEPPMEMFEGNWYCPGTVIHPRWVLTSAACLEDVTKIIIKEPPNIIIKKCMPKEYVFSYDDPGKWMKADIALAQVEKKIPFKPIKFGCKPEQYSPGKRTWILGYNVDTKYGKGGKSDGIDLWKAETTIYPMPDCKVKWPEYKVLVENYMVCTHDDMDEICKDTAVCKTADRKVVEHKAYNDVNAGFCQNDHGGPLLAKEGKETVIIGVVSNMLLDSDAKCVGPFLYTRTDKFMQFISCVTGVATGIVCVNGHETVELRKGLL